MRHQADISYSISRRQGGPSGLHHFPVETAAERRRIFKLRYDAFTRDGLIRENACGSLSDWQDDDRRSTIYGVTLKGQLVATIRLCMITAEMQDCMTCSEFGDIIDPLLHRGKSIADGSRLAVLCDDQATRRRILVHTLGIALRYAQENGADHGMMLARHRHASFYRRCGFEEVYGPFSYDESLVPLSLMMIRMSKPVEQLRIIPQLDHVGSYARA